MDTVLIIQKIESTKSLRKGLKLKKGQTITFHKNYSITKEKGEIIGFEDDAIIVKDKKGKIQTVNLKELLFIGLCMAALTAAFLLFYFVFQKSKGYNLEKRWKAEIGTVEG